MRRRKQAAAQLRRSPSSLRAVFCDRRLVNVSTKCQISDAQRIVRAFHVGAGIGTRTRMTVLRARPFFSTSTTRPAPHEATKVCRRYGRR